MAQLLYNSINSPGLRYWEELFHSTSDVDIVCLWSLITTALGTRTPRKTPGEHTQESFVYIIDHGEARLPRYALREDRGAYRNNDTRTSPTLATAALRAYVVTVNQNPNLTFVHPHNQQ